MWCQFPVHNQWEESLFHRIKEEMFLSCLLRISLHVTDDLVFVYWESTGVVFSPDVLKLACVSLFLLHQQTFLQDHVTCSCNGGNKFMVFWKWVQNTSWCLYCKNEWGRKSVKQPKKQTKTQKDRLNRQKTASSSLVGRGRFSWNSLQQCFGCCWLI